MHDVHLRRSVCNNSGKKMRAKLESRSKQMHPYVQCMAKLITQHRSKYGMTQINGVDVQLGSVFVDLLVQYNLSDRYVTLVQNRDDSEDMDLLSTLSDVEHFVQQLCEGEIAVIPSCFVLDAVEKPLLRSVFEIEDLELIVVFNRSGWCHVWNRAARNSSAAWTYYQSTKLTDQHLSHVHYDPATAEVIAIEETLSTDMPGLVVSTMWVCSLAFLSRKNIELSKRATLSTFPARVLRFHCDNSDGIWVICTHGQVYYYDFALGRSYDGCSVVSSGASSVSRLETPASCLSTIATNIIDGTATDNEASTSRLFAICGHSMQVFVMRDGQLRRLCAYDLRRILRSRKNGSRPHSVLDITTVVLGQEMNFEHAGGEDCDVVALLTQTECLLVLVQLPGDLQEDAGVVSQCIALPLPRQRRRNAAVRGEVGEGASTWRFQRTVQRPVRRGSGDRHEGHSPEPLCTITDGCREFDIRLDGGNWSHMTTAAEVWSHLFRPCRSAGYRLDQPWSPPPHSRLSSGQRYDSDDSFLRRYLLAEREALDRDTRGGLQTESNDVAVQELCADPSGVKLDRAMLGWYQNHAHSNIVPEVLSIQFLRGLAEELVCSPEDRRSVSSKHGDGTAVRTQSPPNEAQDWSWLSSFDLLSSHREEETDPGVLALMTAPWSAVLDPLLLLALVEAVSGHGTNNSADLMVPQESRPYVLPLSLRVIFYQYPEHFVDIVRFLRQHEGRLRQNHEILAVAATHHNEFMKGEPTRRLARPVLRAPRLVHTVGAAPPRLPPAPMTLQPTPAPMHRQHADIGEDDDIFGLSSQLMREARAIPTPTFSFIPDRYGRAHRNLAQTVVEDADGRRWLATSAGAKGSVFRPLPGSDLNEDYSDTESEHSGEGREDDDAFGIFREVGGASRDDSATEVTGGGSPRARSHASTPRGLFHLDELVVGEADLGGAVLLSHAEITTTTSMVKGRRLERAVSPLLSQSEQLGQSLVAAAAPAMNLLDAVITMAENLQRVAGREDCSLLTGEHHRAMGQVLLSRAHCPVQAVAYLAAVRQYHVVFQLTMRLCASVSVFEAPVDSELGSRAATPTPKPTPRFAPLRKARSMEGLETVSDWEALLGYVTATTESLVAGSLNALVAKLSARVGAGAGDTDSVPALTTRQICVVETIVALKLAIKCLLAAPVEVDQTDLGVQAVVAYVLQLLQARPAELTTEAVRAWVTVYAPTAELRRQLLCSTVFIP